MKADKNPVGDNFEHGDFVIWSQLPATILRERRSHSNLPNTFCQIFELGRGMNTPPPLPFCFQNGIFFSFLAVGRRLAGGWPAVDFDSLISY